MPPATPPIVTKDQLVERAQLLRVHVANCDIEHPTANEQNFRWATMKRIAQLYDYGQVKGVELVVAPETVKR